MRSRLPAVQRASIAIAVALTSLTVRPGNALEVGQGVFTTHLDDHEIHCSAGVPIVTGYTSGFSFDDREFIVVYPPEQRQLVINLSELGGFNSTGTLNCVFDRGGTFQATAVNDAGDFQWTEIQGDYIDRIVGIREGDVFPFSGGARCATTRTDDLRLLCDHFDFSFNGLARALAPQPDGFFHDFAGDFTMRAVYRVDVPGPKSDVEVQAVVDGAGGALPEVHVAIDGVTSPGRLAVTTLADAHGDVPRGVEFPVRGATEIDHGSGPVPLFAGGDARFVELATDATLAPGPVEVCLPMPATVDPSEVRPVRVLHGEGADVTTRRFVDRTSKADPTSGMACARVAGFSKFAVVTTDVCGGGQRRADGLLAITGGLTGKRTVIVDGLTDCTQYPANLPPGLRRYCVPDADAVPGQCTASITLGVNRGGCNAVSDAAADPHSATIDLNSYEGTLRQGSSVVDLAPIFGPSIAALGSPVEATVGPVDLVLPAERKVTTYKLKHQLTGVAPQGSRVVTDRDGVRIQCLDPTRY